MKDEKLGVEGSIYARAMEGSQLQLSRMEASFKGFNVDHFGCYMKDIVENMKADPTTIETKILKYSDNPAFGTDYPE